LKGKDREEKGKRGKGTELLFFPRSLLFSLFRRIESRDRVTEEGGKRGFNYFPFLYSERRRCTTVRRRRGRGRKGKRKGGGESSDLGLARTLDLRSTYSGSPAQAQSHEVGEESGRSEGEREKKKKEKKKGPVLLLSIFPPVASLAARDAPVAKWPEARRDARRRRRRRKRKKKRLVIPPPHYTSSLMRSATRNAGQGGAE